MNTKTKITTEEFENLLAHCTGSDHFYRCSLSKVVYTDGVALFSQHNAYWLVSDAMICLKFVPILKKHDFVQIKFARTQNGNKQPATVVYDDGDGNILHTQEYTDTQAPCDSVTFFYENGTMCLPSER